jgi:hypothetical protein
MRNLILLTFSIVVSNISVAQKAKNGSYTYTIRWDEFGGKDLGNTCTVIVYNDSIKVIHNGKTNLTGNKGDLLYQGIILKHKSGKWIIGHSRKDRSAKEIGGCAEGPTLIDFKQKIIWLC